MQDKKGPKILSSCGKVENARCLPIVVWLAVEFCVARVAGVSERAAAHAAAEAVLVPGELAHPHQVAVLDLLAASLADLHYLLSLDARAQLCGERVYG